MKRLADTTLPGVGEILGAYANRSVGIIAIASEFRLLTQPPARASYGGTNPRNRLCVYERGSRRPFAHLDTIRFPINDVAFHPVQPVVAIATGRYDGGWMFEGELVLWNWKTGEIGKPLIQSPEIVRVTFAPDGNSLVAYCRPWDEGMAQEDDAFDMFFELRATYFEDLSQGVGETDAVLAQMERQKPKSAKDISSDTRFRDAEELERVVFELTGTTSINQRSPIWDVAWFGTNMFGVVHDSCHLQTISLQDEIIHTFEGTGHGCEILSGTTSYVHVVERDDTKWPDDFSASLLAIQNGELKSQASFIGAHTFSISDFGTILARRNRSGVEEREAALDRYYDGKEWHPLALGHFDLFNHYIRIDGAPYLFFVQNDQPFADPFDFLRSGMNNYRFKHPQKWIGIIDKKGNQRRLWTILQSDDTDASHPLECDFAYLSDDLGEALVVGGKHYDPNPFNTYEGFVYRRDLWTGKELWRHPISSSPSVIKYNSETGIVLIFTLNGEYLIVNAKTGSLLVRKLLKDIGLPTVAFSAALSDSKIALGLMDGGVLITDLPELIT